MEIRLDKYLENVGCGQALGALRPICQAVSIDLGKAYGSSITASIVKPAAQ